MQNHNFDKNRILTSSINKSHGLPAKLSYTNHIISYTVCLDFYINIFILSRVNHSKHWNTQIDRQGTILTIVVSSS